VGALFSAAPATLPAQATTTVERFESAHRNLTLAIRYVSQGSAPNFMSTDVFHWLIAADGNTKLEVEHADETCTCP
jgi:hypothetical protein